MFFKALLLSFAIESGFVSGGLFNYSARNVEWQDIGALYASLDATASLGAAYIGGEMISYFTPRSLIDYSPFQMTFIARAGFNFGNIKR